MKTKPILDAREGISLMNIQYAVMFGLIFSFTFSVDSCPKSHIATAIRHEIFFVFVPLLLYFLIDWARSNFLWERITFSFFIVFFWTLGIWSLGLIIVMSNALGSLRHVLLAAYIVCVSIYDIVFIIKKVIKDLTPKQSRSLGVVAGITLFFGAVFLFCTLFPNSWAIDDCIFMDLNKLAPIISIAFFATRGIIRTALLFG